jgi:hypothetical protein
LIKRRRGAAALPERLSDEQAAALLDIMEALAAGEAGPPDAALEGAGGTAPSGEPVLKGAR